MCRASVVVVAFTFLLTFVLTLATGCGSDHSNTGADTGPPQFQVSLHDFSDETKLNGTMSVSGSGMVTTKLTGADASTTYTLQLCPAPAQNYSCFKVADIATDASGNATTTVKFPKSGSWAGDFHLDSEGSTKFVTDFWPDMPSQTFSATLQPSSTANGPGIFINGFHPSSQDPLTDGTVKWVTGSLQFDLKEASPSTTYGAGECPIFFGSNCYTLYDASSNGAFTTDASGNITFTVLPDGVPGDIFEINPPGDRAGFVVARMQ
jgi:hypothetical protein